MLFFTCLSLIQVCTLTPSHLNWESSNLCINAIVMKIISFFINFKFVNPVPRSFKGEFLNELHTSLLPYKDLHFIIWEVLKVIALFDLDISSKILYMQLLLQIKWECYFLLLYGDLYIATLNHFWGIYCSIWSRIFLQKVCATPLTFQMKITIYLSQKMKDIGGDIQVFFCV